MITDYYYIKNKNFTWLQIIITPPIKTGQQLSLLLGLSTLTTLHHYHYNIIFISSSSTAVIMWRLCSAHTPRVYPQPYSLHHPPLNPGLTRVHPYVNTLYCPKSRQKVVELAYLIDYHTTTAFSSRLLSTHTGLGQRPGGWISLVD